MGRNAKRMTSDELAVKRKGYKQITFGYCANEATMLDRAVRQLGNREFQIVPNTQGQLAIWVLPGRSSHGGGHFQHSTIANASENATTEAVG